MVKGDIDGVRGFTRNLAKKEHRPKQAVHLRKTSRGKAEEETTEVVIEGLPVRILSVRQSLYHHLSSLPI